MAVLPALSTADRLTAALRAGAGELLAIAVLLPAAAAFLPIVRGDGLRGFGTLLSVGNRELFGTTLAFAGMAATVAVIVGGVIAKGAIRLPGRWAWMVAVAGLLPLLVPASLMATAWIMAMGRDGVVTVAASAWGVALPTVYDGPMPAILAGCRAAGLPAAILLLAWRRRRATTAVEDALRIGVSQRWIWLRLAPTIPPLIAGWLLSFLIVLVDPIFPGMLLEHTYATQMLIEYNALMNPPGAAVLGVPLAAMGIGAGVLAWWLRPTRSSSEPELPPHAVPRRRDAPAVLVAALAIGACVGVPILALAARTGTIGAVWAAAGEAGPELVRTLLLTAAGSIGAAAVGAVLAAHGGWMRGHGRASLAPLVLVNLALPPTLLGVGCLELARRPELAWLRGGDAMLLAGYVARFSPLAALILSILWAHDRDHAAVVAARRLGLSPLRTAVHIVGPARLRDTALVAAALSLPLLSEVELSILLAPPGVTTLGVRLYTMIHTSPDQAVSALALLVLAITVAAAGVSAAALHRLRHAAPSRPTA